MLQGVGTLLSLSIVSGSSNIGPMLGEGGLGFSMLCLPGEGGLGKAAAVAAGGGGGGTCCTVGLEAQLLLARAAANNAASTSIPAALSVSNM